MAVSIGDFKPDEIYNLIENKDPLALNKDIEGHPTINNKQLSEKHMEYDAILHYIKMASNLKTSNVNNNADSNPEPEDTKTKDTKDTTPSQVNYPSTSRNTPYNTRLPSISSNNLSCKVSFKSFKNIQQSCKRSHTNSCNEITCTSSDPNLNLISNSNELLDEFNTKTNEITKGLHELHFSTIDLRNKLSKGRVNNNCPIITQVTGRNNASTTNQVRVDIYPLGQSCWHEIRGFLHKEMNLWIKAA